MFVATNEVKIKYDFHQTQKLQVSGFFFLMTGHVPILRKSGTCIRQVLMNMGGGHDKAGHYEVTHGGYQSYKVPFICACDCMHIVGHL